IRLNPRGSRYLAMQEPGVRTSCPLPYQLEVDGSLNDERTAFVMKFEAKSDVFGERSAGAPFIVHALDNKGPIAIRNYAVEAGQSLEDAWRIADFAGCRYPFRVYGPNGFFREFGGAADDPAVEFQFSLTATSLSRPLPLTGGVVIHAINRDPRKSYTVEVRDHS